MHLYATNPITGRFAKFRFSQGLRLDLYDTLAAYIRDGVDLHTILTKVGNEYRSTNFLDVRDTILLEWAAAMDRGSLSFSGAITPWVPASEVMLIRSGEESGDLPAAFDSVMFSASSIQQMKSRVIKAVAIPLVTLALLIGMFVGADKAILPAFSELAPRDTWPATGQALYLISHGLAESILFILAGVVASAAVLGWLLPNFTGRFRELLDRGPIFSTYRSLQSATFLVSLSAQMRCGIPLADAIDNLMEISSPYVAYRLHQTSIRLGLGGNPGRALDSGFLDMETGIKVRLLSETTSLDKAMDSIGRSSISESLGSIERKARFVAIVNGFLIAASLIWMSFSMQAITQSLQSAAGAGV